MDHYWQSWNRDGQQLRICAIFQDNSLDLTIFENETAWNVHVIQSELATQSKNNLPEYYENLRKYFECCPEHVQFHFNDGEFSINMLLKNKMKQLYFNAVLDKVDFIDSIFKLMDVFYRKKVNYFKELDDVKTQVTFLTKEHDTLERKMSEFLDRRKNEELKTYNNFIAILNEKKRQILHLNELLIAFRQGRSTVNPPVQLKRKTESKTSIKNNKKNVPTPPSSLSNSDTDYDTDQGVSNNKHVGDNDIVLGEVHNNMSSVPTTSKIKDEYESPTQLSYKPFEFPKRIQTEVNLDHLIILPEKDGVKMSKEQDVEDESISNCNKNIPLVDFNTQDLLDNI